MENKKNKNSNIKKVIITIVWVAGIIGGVYLFFFCMQLGLNTSIPITVVSGRSMEPTYYEGDILIVQGVPVSNIVCGDHNTRNGSVIVYKRSYDNLLIVHRVTGIRYNYSGSGIYEFETWGDNNPIPDGWQPQSSVMGIVILRIPWLGWASLMFTKYPVIGISIIVLLLFILVISSFDVKEKNTENGTPPTNNMVWVIKWKIRKIQIWKSFNLL